MIDHFADSLERCSAPAIDVESQLGSSTYAGQTATPNRASALSLTADLTAPQVASTSRRRWWIEVAAVLAFYGVYTLVRNQFGSAAVEPQLAYDNAIRIIDIEKAIGLFQEQRIQSWFGDSAVFFTFWNIFYGTLHFAVTIFCFVYLYRTAPNRYGIYRTTFASTTGLALIGFSTFPLMPPRLLNVGGSFGGESFGGGSYTFVDTVAEYGGLWSFDTGAMAEISNQYAAMPSLHFAWSLWCAVAVVPVLSRRIGKISLALYPVLTLFAIVVTGNHYWIDAVGGLIALGVGFGLATILTRLGRDALHKILTKTSRA